MVYKIDKAVPVPKIGNDFMDTLRALEPGESFEIEHGTNKSGLTRLKELKPKKFMTRRTDTGRRIWRIA